MVIYFCDSEYSEVILITNVEFPSHPNISSNDFFEELKNKYSDIIIYEDKQWINDKYFNKYNYLLKKYSDIKKIIFKYNLEKK